MMILMLTLVQKMVYLDWASLKWSIMQDYLYLLRIIIITGKEKEAALERHNLYYDYSVPS